MIIVACVITHISLVRVPEVYVSKDVFHPLGKCIRLTNFTMSLFLDYISLLSDDIFDLYSLHFSIW